MRPLEELTLYANGFLEEHEEAVVKAHVESCAGCTAELRRLKTERGLLLRAAAVDGAVEAPPGFSPRPPRPARAGLLVTGLAAALLLAVLVWLLSRPASSRGPADISPLAQSSGEDIDRLIGELQSSSALRREIAAAALKAYGSAALGKLEKANADPVLLDACRGIKPGDRAILKKLGELRVTFDMKNAPLTDVLNYVGQVSQFNFHLSGVDQPDRGNITVKVTERPLEEALRLVLEPEGLSYRVRNGVVMVSTPAQLKDLGESPAPPLAPIRLPLQEAVARRYISALGSDAFLERDHATAALLRLGLSAEPLLWKALESTSPEVRDRAAELLRQLYDPRPAGRLDDASRRLDELKPDLNFENAKTSEVLGFLGDSLGLTILVNPESADMNKKVTFKTKDLVAKNSLKLFVSQFVLDFVVVDGGILVLEPSAGNLRTPLKPIWKTPEESRRVEATVRQVALDDQVDVLRTCTTEDLGALLQASLALEGPPGRRCRQAAALVAENAHFWLIDQASGVDLQEPTEAQRKILNQEVKTLEDERLGAALGRQGLKVAMKTQVDLRVRAYGAVPKLSSLLKSVLRPAGYDFYMDGETLVIDTLSNVRAALKK